ncbi:GNAT family N-acetyltransferase [Aquibacillus koreensis]|uniref:GNAT family N-acetyltransferase n=1 Tax=Aquibacillus koreensis TaxID=279446 RepID=A0A9X3WNX2_9BACI|nr:GNAT family N-acetyltransferase [Aquibacillus koreensis]MCT2534276.1 GNAT family N-acetyltransferase [Aquibacillus koreensis]MDC3420679.1 GNAT family N-acetyltransferase [Aquibacillus koreensis]
MISLLTNQQAEQIRNWKYEAPYDFYNHDDSEEGMQELLNGTFYGCLNEKQQLIGYYCFGQSAQVPGGVLEGVYKKVALDIGLAMDPNHTGKGFGESFINKGLRFATELFCPNTIRLSVASFNKRAITVYKRAGFEYKDMFNNKGTSFITMEYAVSYKAEASP